MRFKAQQQNSQLPEIELTPMLNVMMGILAFFVMITMMLTVEQGVDINLPSNTNPEQTAPSPLIVTLNAQNQILLNNQPIAPNELSAQIEVFLSKTNDGFVVLKADPELPYEQVVQLLSAMKDVGGDRVSLAIE